MNQPKLLLNIMKTRNLLLHLIFPVIVLMVLVNFDGQGRLLKVIFKPMIMVWVALYFTSNLANRHHPVVKPALFAFFFSWVGDIALLFSGTTFFLSGLSSFLISHLFYIYLFQKTDANFSESLISRKSIWILPFLLVGVTFLWVLLPKIESSSIKIAMIFYTLTILTMAASALNRVGGVSTKSFILVLVGAIFFISSDSMIAINKFVTKIPMSGFWVMSTYISAQVMIMLGLLAQVKRKVSGNDTIQQAKPKNSAGS